MFDTSLLGIFAGLTGVIFLVGAVGNWIAPPRIAADYARWNYPSYFHYVTALMELATGVLLLPSNTRPYGAALGVLVMAAALATLLKHKEYRHAVPPATSHIRLFYNTDSGVTAIASISGLAS